MTIQLDIFSVHTNENNHDSKRHLEENRTHFSHQCEIVLRLLKTGIRLTTLNAPLYGILSLPRRVKDLIDNNGVEIKSEWVKDEENKTRYKEYFL